MVTGCPEAVGRGMCGGTWEYIPGWNMKCPPPKEGLVSTLPEIAADGARVVLGFMEAELVEPRGLLAATGGAEG